MKIILFTTLLLFSVNGFTHNWKKVLETSKNDYYVDVSDIKKRNSFIYFWVLTDYLEPVFNNNSHISKYKVNCSDYWGNLFVLSWTNYSKPMGKGEIRSDETVNIVQYTGPEDPGPLYKIMKFACNNAR